MTYSSYILRFGHQIFHAKEESGFCGRQCCNSLRYRPKPAIIHIFDRLIVNEISCEETGVRCTKVLIKPCCLSTRKPMKMFVNIAVYVLLYTIGSLTKINERHIVYLLSKIFNYVIS